MDILPSVSSIKLDRSVHFCWLFFLLCSIVAFSLFKFAFSMKSEMWSRIDDLGRMQCEIEKTALSCDQYLNYYIEQSSQATDIDTKFQLSQKIAEYENLKAQNDLERNYYQKQLTDFDEGLKSTLDRMLLCVLVMGLFVGLIALSLSRVLIVLYENSKVYTKCQSCGRTQNSVLMNFGTERDGTHSRCFCNQCYVTGKFINPNMTLEDMQSQVRKEMAEKGIPVKMIDKECQTINKLKRWVYARTY